MVVPLRRSRPTLPASPTSSTAPLLAYFRKPTLGDKLHRLARTSPRHLRVVELLVDRMLTTINRKAG